MSLSAAAAQVSEGRRNASPTATFVLSVRFSFFGEALCGLAASNQSPVVLIHQYFAG
jgi:hypothetical protein